MPKLALNEKLIKRTQRRMSKQSLSINDCVAANLFWRREVKVAILTKVFGVSRNTLYYKALTGGSSGYPDSDTSNTAAQVNAYIDRVGPKKAWEEVVTDAMVERVNQELANEAERRQPAPLHFAAT